MAQDNQVNRISMRQVSGFSRSKKVKADLGPESDFTDLPKLVKVGTANYFLVKSDEGYRMLSTMCPHQGGEVEDIGEDVFVCDGHGWEYEKTGGRCVNNPDFRMRAFLVTKQDNNLVALVPDE